MTVTISSTVTSPLCTDPAIKSDIIFLAMRHLDGPNVWTYYPVIESIIDIGSLEDSPSNTIPGFYERLSSWLPSLVEHRCSYEERGGFLRRLQEGTWPGHILEHVTLELQNLAGMPGAFGRARETAQRGVYKVVVSAWQKDIAQQALLTARELVLAAMRNQVFDTAAAISHLRDMTDTLWLGPSTACIVNVASDRKIPFIRLLARGNLVQLGYGARSHRIWTAETDHTSAIAEGISRDKDLTKTLLRSCGVPVPEGRVADSPEDAWHAAESIGLPVVVKPCDGNHGRGVFIELSTREEIESAWLIAQEEGNGVLVERCIPGTEHRLLVVGGRLVAASRGDTVSVTGDGHATLTQLIENQINSDPRRGTTEHHPLNMIRLDSAARMEIARQGLTSESVPPAGRVVLIQRNGNHAFDVTDEVHPDTAAAASLAARVVGLDIAGIDLVATDISRPLSAQGGAIVEVNAGPGLLMHIKPAVGTARPVGESIMDHLFPEEQENRIPVIGVSGGDGRTTVAHLVARLLTASGKYTGLACRSGLYLDHQQVRKDDCATREAASQLLVNRSVSAAVIENDSNVILNEGLAYDRCQIGIITSAHAADHYCQNAFDRIDTPEQVFRILRTQVDVVLPDGAAVLNAREPMLVDMAPLCDGEVIYFSSDPDLPAVISHCAQGHRAVVLRDRGILLATGRNETMLARLDDLFPSGNPSVPSVEQTMAAIAAAWALRIAPEHIRHELVVPEQTLTAREQPVAA